MSFNPKNTNKKTSTSTSTTTDKTNLFLATAFTPSPSSATTRKKALVVASNNNNNNDDNNDNMPPRLDPLFVVGTVDDNHHDQPKTSEASTTTTATAVSSQKPPQRKSLALRRAWKGLLLPTKHNQQSNNNDNNDNKLATTSTSTTTPLSATETTPLVRVKNAILSTPGPKKKNNNNNNKHRRRRRALPLGQDNNNNTASLFGNTTTTTTTTTTNNNYNTNNDTTRNDVENPHQIQLCQRAAQGWQRIRTEVSNGDMLLRAAAATTTTTTTNPTSSQPLSDNDNNKEQQRLAAQEWIRARIEFNLAQCLAAMLAYMVVAIVAFSFVWENWTWIDSIYWALVTFSTIGYGDVVPQGRVEKVFTIVYALSGIACLGIALGVIGTNVMEAQEQAVEQTKKMAQARVLNLFGSDSTRSSSSSSSSSKSARPLQGGGTGGETDTDETTATNTLGSEQRAKMAQQNATAKDSNSVSRKSNPLHTLLFHFLLVLVILVIFAFCVASDPGIDVDRVDIFDALYYTIITASTVGYGDYAPQTQRGRLLAIFFIPLSVGAMGHFLSSVASVIMDSRRSHFQKQMDQHELSMQDLEIMDEDGDGLVTRAEYLEFMLIAMNKVDKDFIDEIRRSFARLDTDGTGCLSKEDMVAAARLKLRSPTKKMELAQYKERLLQQAQRAREERERKHTRKHSHRKTGSFWEDSFGFVGKVFSKDEDDTRVEYDDSVPEKHPLLS